MDGNRKANYAPAYLACAATGPDETDVNLTVSQINTHKIRGTMCVMVAEENAALREAVTKAPTDNPNYRSVGIPLPATGDNLLTIFTATVVLQRLALRMSVLNQPTSTASGSATTASTPTCQRT